MPRLSGGQSGYLKNIIWRVIPQDLKGLGALGAEKMVYKYKMSEKADFGKLVCREPQFDWVSEVVNATS